VKDVSIKSFPYYIGMNLGDVGYTPWNVDLMKKFYGALEDLMKISYATLVGVV